MSSPLRQFRPLIRTGNVGIEVSGLCHRPEPGAAKAWLDANNFPDQSLFDLRQFLQWHNVHLIPEVLAGEICGGELHQFRQIRCCRPNRQRLVCCAGRRRARSWRSASDSPTVSPARTRTSPTAEIARLICPATSSSPGQADQSSHGTRGNRRDFYGDFGVLLVTVQNLIHAPRDEQGRRMEGFCLPLCGRIRRCG